MITALDTERCLIHRTNGGMQREATEWTFTVEPTPDG